MKKVALIILIVAYLIGCASLEKSENQKQVISKIEIDGKPWIQVKSFENSLPDDRHYVLRMEEDGTASIRFGDGEHGARLPSGTGEVRVHYSGVNQQQGRLKLDGSDNCK